VLNPNAKNYTKIKHTWETDYEDNHWAEDSIFLERNSRDFITRIARINANAEAICDVLLAHPRGKALYHTCCSHLIRSIVKQVNYPRHSPTRPFYDRCRNSHGGYGGLLSATFYTREDVVAFFDNLDTVKGPSLGTNFTLRYVRSIQVLCYIPSDKLLTVKQLAIRHIGTLRRVGLGECNPVNQCSLADFDSVRHGVLKLT
jgi:cystathionine beta-lyase/cystathionine gamma-synthase